MMTEATDKSGISIRNWHRFQHFKNRKPPWVKLYRDLLDDINWHNLDALSAKILVMLWLIASEDDGNLPSIRVLAFRLRVTEKQVNKAVSDLSHWLEQNDITAISGGYQDDALETEGEGETKEEREIPAFATEIANALLTSILSWKPDFKPPTPVHLRKWADDCRKAVQIDSRTQEAMMAVVQWLPSHGSDNGFRWRENVLSGQKLRAQFDKLTMAMQKDSPPPTLKYDGFDDDGKRITPEAWRKQHGLD